MERLFEYTIGALNAHREDLMTPFTPGLSDATTATAATASHEPRVSTEPHDRPQIESIRRAGGATPGERHPSPSLPLLAAIHIGLFMASMITALVLAGGAVFPSPLQPEIARAYFGQHADALRVP